MKQIALIALFSLVFACERDKGASPSVSLSNSDLLQPARASDTGRHIEALAAMFEADTRAHRKTFGFSPPDSSEISLVTDVAVYSSAKRALDSTLFAMGGKRGDQTDKGSLYVYRTGSLYVVVDVNEESGGDQNTMPSFFFFDSLWRYLGTRSM